jgi:hypothetical protein
LVKVGNAKGRQPLEHRDHELEVAEGRILELLDGEEAAYSTRELIERLKESDGEAISEEAIRVALWDLIGRGNVEFTRGQELKSSKFVAVI